MRFGNTRAPHIVKVICRQGLGVDELFFQNKQTAITKITHAKLVEYKQDKSEATLANTTTHIWKLAFCNCI
jgi:hypothetical protein